MSIRRMPEQPEPATAFPGAGQTPSGPENAEGALLHPDAAPEQCAEGHHRETAGEWSANENGEADKLAHHRHIVRVPHPGIRTASDAAAHPERPGRGTSTVSRALRLPRT